ncbi:GNAT family N-acetyltransferase [Bacillus sp. N9]
MIIRQIKLEDAEQFANLLVSIDASNMMLYDPGERKTSQEQEEKRIEAILLQGNSTIIVAEQNDRLIGYVIIFGGTSNRNRHSAYIVCGVLEDYRGQGIAVMLFEEAFAGRRK